jgi:polyisoprenyl-teichoic acid--peptidoglycan teichoic acid transferase
VSSQSTVPPGGSSSMVQFTSLSHRIRVKAFGVVLAGLASPLARLPRLALAQDGITPATIRQPLTLIVGGLDTREEDQPENTDVVILARVDLQQLTVRAISIPRDLYLEIPNYGYDKITRAYDFGSKSDNRSFKTGAQLVKETVNLNFGLNVDGVVLSTFGGLIEIVDTLGGIDVENPYDLYDGEYPTIDYGYAEIYFPAGALHLSGEEALQFARTRHQDGDDGRVMRQQLVIRALLERARDPEVSDQLPDIVAEHAKAVRTDLSRSKRLTLALAAPSFSNDSVTFGTLNGLVYPDSTAAGMWIYSGDWSQIPGYVESFLSGAI